MFYATQIVGDFAADLVVDNKVIIEVKAVKTLNKAHEAQLINYLKATGMHVGLLVNFGPTVQVARRVF